MNNKRRVCTTISAKHWDILKKHTGKFETQQKALEFALENLENDSKQSPALSPEEQHWMRIGREMMAPGAGIIVHKEIFKVLIETADFDHLAEVIINQKLVEHVIFWYFQRPIKKFHLKEFIDGIILFFRVGHMLDMINYSDDGNYYTLKIIHSININYSKFFEVLIEILFNAYGAKTESEVYEKSLFIRIYKNL